MTIHAIFSPRFALPSNAVKSLLFDISAIFLQLTVMKLFTILSYHGDAFTPFLIFSEPLLQQLLYILHRGSFLVLSFVVLFHAAGFWDTMLWGLDRPGIILGAHRVDAATAATHRRQNPPYAVSSQSIHNIHSDIGSGLWEGVNITLAGIAAAGTPAIATSPKWSGSQFPGARIYLDDEGWSVSIDLLKNVVASFACPESYPNVMDVSWECEYDYRNNSRTATDYLVDSFALPNVWWSNAQGLVEYETLAPEPGMNPWEALGTGGGTVMMKMVFALTRERRRHTFMVSAMKTTLLAPAESRIQIAEVRDLVERTWRARDDAALLEHDVDAVGRLLDGGMTGLVMGRQHADGYKVTSRVYSLLAPLTNVGIRLFTAFQILDSNLTLINSETVDVAPTPFEDCDTWYRNEAYGGVVTGSNCIVAERGNGKTAVFQGQADTLAVFVLQGVLGKKRAGTAAAALNDTAWSWVQENDDFLESLVLSRAYIVGGNAGAVKIDVNTLRPALSMLQILLMVLPPLWFLVTWGVVLGWVGGHYQVSLLTNLVATTHEGLDGAKPDFMTKIPKMGLVLAGGKVHLGTRTGVFFHSERDGLREGEGEGDWRVLQRQEVKQSSDNPGPVYHTVGI